MCVYVRTYVRVFPIPPNIPTRACAKINIPPNEGAWLTSHFAQAPPNVEKKRSAMPFVEIDFSELEFFERLGSGAAGTVYRALWKTQEKVVAVKKLLQLEAEVVGPAVVCGRMH